jgi:Carboxypeptidase regulatory-like domain
MKPTGRLLFLSCVLVAWFCVGFATIAAAQGSYRAQLRGVVSDASGAVVHNATVTITETGTNISSVGHTDDKGEYFFTGLRPSTYSVKVQITGFRTAEKTGVVLAVDQEASLNFSLTPAGISEKIEVTMSAPLLDTENATLGTDVTGEYVHDLPLLNRNFFGLTFLAGGVTEAAGSGTQDNYPTGTNFVSNGQRNATAEIRLDGALISAPEQGEGGNSNVYYEPLVDGVQEFKVQNNSFSAEFGNNGGTVVNMVLKSGTNVFHGTGWYFLQRPQMDARDFFNPEPSPKPDSRRDQGGFSIGGPIRKNRTFFFADYEKVSSSVGFNNVATVPTLDERGLNGNGYDFSSTATTIYDPTTCGNPCVTRSPVPGNVIPAGEVDPIGLAVLNLYPKPNLPGEFNNYLFTGVAKAPDYQFDIKVDHQISDKQHINGRYSRGVSNYTTPEILGDGFDNNGTGDGIASSPTTAQNGSFEYTWTVNPRIIWTSHAAVDRVHEAATSNIPTISSFNAAQQAAGQPQLPAVLEQANGLDRMPEFLMSGAALESNASTSADLYDQCCVNTTFAHTLYSYSSQVVISKGSHLIKIGGEQRLFYNNFFQPTGPTGFFNFSDYVTSPTPNSETDSSGNLTGNPFASLLFGYADNVNESTQLIVLPSVANKSKETGFYVQDDWKVTSKLTLNLGLRYQWSTPYNERSNHIEFSNFTADTGVGINFSTVPGTAPAGTLSAQAVMQSAGLNLPTTQELIGTTQFPTSSMRNVPVYRNDIGPRLGFAYGFDSKTVVRGGVGVYFGMSPATNFQYPGTAFAKNATMFFTNNNFACIPGNLPLPCQSATLEDPFPSGFTGPQGKQYGALANWGYGNNNDLGTTSARDAEIYQWNLGIQRELPSQIVLGVDYVANRSTHLPWAGTNNRDFISSSLLAKVAAAETPTDPTCSQDSCVSNFLQTQVGNPFFGMFNQPCAGTCFNEPDSQYGNSTLPLGYLLNPYPQFPGDFEGLMIEEASSWYNAMQIRFQKRTTHHVSFEGSYTISKNTDNSSAGRNSWVGTVGSGSPQQLDNLKAEHSISANDAPQRLAGAVVVDLPIGRNQWIGSGMNRGLDAVIGGWSIATLITEQSGQPMAITDTFGRLANGSQRPSIVCPQLKSGVSMKAAAVSEVAGNPLPIFNVNCFGDPGDQIPGNAPRYFPQLRVNGIHNVDLNVYKGFEIKENMKLEVRAEIFNAANHPRFAAPDTGFEDSSFGTISADANGYLPRYFQFGVRFEF